MLRLAAARFAARKILPLFADIEVRGNVNFLSQGGYLIATNHLGRLDSLLPYYILDTDDVIHPLTDKYKNSLVFRVIAWWLNMTWLTRGQADLKAMREFITRLKRGGVMVIAPEGTRSKTASLLKGEPGVIFIATQAGVPIVPVAITGTEDAVVKSRLKRFQKLRIKISASEAFLPPSIKGADRDQLLREATDEAMCRIAALLPESYRGVYANHPRLVELLDDR